MNLLQKFKETLSSVLPIMAVVFVLNMTVAPLGTGLLLRFLFGGVLVILGLTIFLAGIDIGIMPIGERSGAVLAAKKSLPLLLGVSFLIGIMVTVAEPDVQVLANQIKGVVSDVNKWTLVIMIAIGLAIFVVIGLVRTVLSLNLKVLLLVLYVALFTVAFICPDVFQGMAFDAGGATTGPMTVPFIMALGVGVATVRSKGASSSSSDSEKKTGTQDDSSFGLTGLASIGPVAAVCVYGILHKVLFSTNASSVSQIAQESSSHESITSDGFGVFISLLPVELKEVSFALFPLIILFIAFQIFLLKMPPVQVQRMIKGVLYSFVGLVIFLDGVNGGFMPAGSKLGSVLGSLAYNGSLIWVLLLATIGFIFGAVVVCAEPAVWVLTEQVESISGGTIKRKVMLVALSLGVACSIGISMLRVLYGFSLWYVLLPGYALALLMMIWCPPLFVGIAFDSGGVASGPMTSTFILSFALGVASSCGGNPATDAFGVIALVAMTPLIAIQALGIVFKVKSKKTEEK